MKLWQWTIQRTGEIWSAFFAFSLIFSFFLSISVALKAFLEFGVQNHSFLRPFSYCKHTHSFPSFFAAMNGFRVEDLLSDREKDSTSDEAIQKSPTEEKTIRKLKMRRARTAFTYEQLVALESKFKVIIEHFILRLVCVFSRLVISASVSVWTWLSSCNSPKHRYNENEVLCLTMIHVLFFQGQNLVPKPAHKVEKTQPRTRCKHSTNTSVIRWNPGSTYPSHSSSHNIQSTGEKSTNNKAIVIYSCSRQWWLQWPHLECLYNLHCPWHCSASIRF